MPNLERRLFIFLEQVALFSSTPFILDLFPSSLLPVGVKKLTRAKLPLASPLAAQDARTLTGFAAILTHRGWWLV